MLSEDLVRYVSEIHHTLEDLTDGDLRKRIEKHGLYGLVYVPLSALNISQYALDPFHVETLQKEIILNNGAYPPIIIDSITENIPFTIIDGCHRANALSRLKRKKIWCYVPSKGND